MRPYTATARTLALLLVAAAIPAVAQESARSLGRGIDQAAVAAQSDGHRVGPGTGGVGPRLGGLRFYDLGPRGGGTGLRPTTVVADRFRPEPDDSGVRIDRRAANTVHGRN